LKGIARDARNAIALHSYGAMHIRHLVRVNGLGKETHRYTSYSFVYNE